ncbi:hypothetical protein OAO01_06810 [Oligoflexia bacterium]|nr:hypothetical protein [Oligoflexia bacterium]
MKLIHLSLIVFTVFMYGIQATEAHAARSLRLCYNAQDGTLAAKRRCKKKWQLLTGDNLSNLIGIQGPKGADGAAGADGKDGAAGAAGQDGADGADGKAATALFATVNSDATLIRGSGVSSVSSTSAPIFSTYTVTFNQDVSECTYTATFDAVDDIVPKLNYNIFAAPLSTDVNAVLVAIVDPDLPAFAQSDFHLAVFCS